MSQNRPLQMDTEVRVVALSNLMAICEYASTSTKHYDVVSISDNRIHVSFNNPDEYGVDHPYIAVFPCYPFSHFSSQDAVIVLDPLRYYRDGHKDDRWKGDEHNLFEPLFDVPKLVRHPNGEWFEARRGTVIWPQEAGDQADSE